MKTATILLFLLATTLLGSCGIASPEEMEQRREEAFDVSGKYALSSSQYGSNFGEIKITNESDKSNIYITVDKKGFSPEEESLFAKAGLPLNDVEIFRLKFSFGKGRGIVSPFRGGENVSKDIGKSSHLYVIPNFNEDFRVGEYSVQYMLTEKVFKGDLILRGNLELTVFKYVMINGQRTLTTIGSAALPCSGKIKEAP